MHFRRNEVALVTSNHNRTSNDVGICVCSTALNCIATVHLSTGNRLLITEWPDGDLLWCCWVIAYNGFSSVLEHAPWGPSIKYVTLFWTNFDPPFPLSHFVTHLGTAPKYVTHLGPHHIGVY